MRYQKEKLFKLESKIIKTLLLFSSILIVVYLSIDAYIFSNQFQKLTLNNALYKIDEREKYLNTYIKNAKLQTGNIKETFAFKNYLENGSLDSLYSLFLFIAKNQKNIMQIRYLDSFGKEKIRIERDEIGIKPKVIEESKLQDKSKRDYFLKTKNENIKDVWITSLDLNEEYGEIQKPYKLTFRAILPIQKNNSFDGIIIINYFMNDFLNTFLEDNLYNSILIDNEGFTLIHYDKDKSWGRYKNPQVKFLEDEKILTQKVYKNDYFVSKKLDVSLPNELILVLKLNKMYLEQEKLNEFFSKLSISFIIILFSIILIVIISRLLKKVILDITNYTEYTQMIDENIITSSTDLRGNITYASKAFCKVSGYTESELIGRNHNIVRHPDEKSVKYKELWTALAEDKIWEGEFKNIAKNKKAYWVKAKIYPIYDGKKKVGYTAIRQDITDKKIIEQLSITDSLTSVYNRRYFDEILPKVLNDLKRKDELISFIMIDVDNFKNYNDKYGHQLGDAILAEVGKILKNTLRRSSDKIFRIGGEEFICVCSPKNEEEIFTLAEALRLNVEALNIKDSRITISLGVFTKRARDVENYEELYKMSDKLLYESKESGKNKITSNSTKQ